MSDEARRQIVRTESMLDQRWALLEADLPDLDRMAFRGPDGSPEDDRRMMLCIQTVMAEIHHRRSQRPAEDLREGT